MTSGVTVIVCTCNRARYLEKCLESVYSQDHPPSEVLVVNGPSVDDTMEVASRMGARVVQQSGQGIANARNIGVEAARNELIAFIDDDCLAARDWLGKLVLKLEEPGVSGVGGKAVSARDGRTEFENGYVGNSGLIRSHNPSPQPYYLSGGGRFNNVVCMNAAFKRSAVKAVGGFDEYFNYYFEETDLCVRMTQAGYRIVHEPRAVVEHEFAEGQNRKSRWEQNWYMISRNSTYMPFKNFNSNVGILIPVKLYHYARRMGSVLIPFFMGEIPPSVMAKICKDITRGLYDGVYDGMRARRQATYFSEADT